MGVSAQVHASCLIRLKAPALAERVVEAHYRLRPELAGRYGESGRRHCLDDAMFHLNFLAAAVEFGDARIFADYVAWVADLLSRRGIPAHDLAENMRVLTEVIDADLPATPAALARPHLDAAFGRIPQSRPNVARGRRRVASHKGKRIRHRGEAASNQP